MIRNDNYKPEIEEQEEIEEEVSLKEVEEDNESLEKNTNKVFDIAKDWLIALVIAIALYFLITNYVVFQAYIPSPSMNPTLYEGDRVLVTKIYNMNSIKRGDILVFHNYELKDILIKRVIGLPGDMINIVDGVVTVNGEVLQEDYVKIKDKSTQKDGTYLVPENDYFFLGDNRPVSLDSAMWKNPFIDKSDIMGKAQIKVYPFNEFGSLK